MRNLMEISLLLKTIENMKNKVMVAMIIIKIISLINLNKIIIILLIIIIHPVILLNLLIDPNLKQKNNIFLKNKQPNLSIVILRKIHKMNNLVEKQKAQTTIIKMIIIHKTIIIKIITIIIMVITIKTIIVITIIRVKKMKL